MFPYSTNIQQGAERVIISASIRLISFYRVFLSPYIFQLVGIKPECRFSPTCSQYMAVSLDRFGMRGFEMGIRQLLSCRKF